MQGDKKVNWLKHTLINVLLLVLIFPFIKPTRGEIYILMLAGVLIDTDHLINDISKKRIVGKGLKGAIKFWWQAGNFDFNEFHFLHNIEIIALLFLLSFTYKESLLFISLGFLFHISGDAIMAIRQKESLRALRKYSLIYFLHGNY